MIEMRAHPFCIVTIPCWRHQMETFSALLALCPRNSLVTGELPAQRPVTQSFDLRPNKRLRLVIWDTIELIMASS